MKIVQCKNFQDPTIKYAPPKQLSNFSALCYRNGSSEYPLMKKKAFGLHDLMLPKKKLDLHRHNPVPEIEMM